MIFRVLLVSIGDFIDSIADLGAWKSGRKMNNDRVQSFNRVFKLRIPKVKFRLKLKKDI